MMHQAITKCSLYLPDMELAAPYNFTVFGLLNTYGNLKISGKTPSYKLRFLWLYFVIKTKPNLCIIKIDWIQLPDDLLIKLSSML